MVLKDKCRTLQNEFSSLPLFILCNNPSSIKTLFTNTKDDVRTKTQSFVQMIFYLIMN